MLRFELKSVIIRLLFLLLLFFEHASTIHDPKDRIKTSHYHREPYISEALANHQNHNNEGDTHEKPNYRQINDDDASLNYQQGSSGGYQNIENGNAHYQGQYASQTTSQTFEYYTKCPSGYKGVLPYAHHCHRFLNCWNGRGYLQDCAPGTAFNPQTLDCDSPEKVSCSGIGGNPIQYNPSEAVEEPPPFTQVRTGRLQAEPDYLNYDQTELSCPQGVNGVLPHPKDCSKFLNCANGMAYIQSCGPNTMFSATMFVCDFPHKVDCGTRANIGLDETFSEIDKNYFSVNSNDGSALDENKQQNYGESTNGHYDHTHRDSKSFNGGNRQNQLTDQQHHHPGGFLQSTQLDTQSNFDVHNHKHRPSHRHHHHYQHQPSEAQPTYTQSQLRPPYPHQREHRPQTPPQEEYRPRQPPQEEQSVYHDRWTQMNRERPKAPGNPNSPGNPGGSSRPVRPQYIPATHPVMTTETRTINENRPTSESTQHQIQPSWEDSDSKTVPTWTTYEGKDDYQPTKIYGNGPPNINTHTTTNTIYYAQPVDDNENSDEYFQSPQPSNVPNRKPPYNRNSTTILIANQPSPDDSQVNIPLGYPSTKNQPDVMEYPKRPSQTSPSSNQPYYPQQPKPSSSPRTLYYPEPPTKSSTPRTSYYPESRTSPTKSSTPRIPNYPESVTKHYEPPSPTIPIDNVPSKTNVRVFQVFPLADNASLQIFPDPYYSKSYSGVAHSRNNTALYSNNNPSSFDPSKRKQFIGSISSRGSFLDPNNPQPEVVFSRDADVVLSAAEPEYEETQHAPVYIRPILNSQPTERTLSSTTEPNSRPGYPSDYQPRYYRQSTPSTILSEHDDEKPTTDLSMSDAIRALLRPYKLDKNDKIANDIAVKSESHIMSLVVRKDPTQYPLQHNIQPPSTSPLPLIPKSTNPLNIVHKEAELIFTGEQAEMSQTNHSNQQNFLKPTNNWPLHNNYKHSIEFHQKHPNIPNPSVDNEYNNNPNREFTTKSTILKLVPTSKTDTGSQPNMIYPRFKPEIESTTRPYKPPPIQHTGSQEIDDDMSQKTIPTKFNVDKNVCEFDCGNGTCIKLFEVCDGINNCNNRKDEKQCDHLGYEVRLSNEDGSRNRGRVEVKILGKWGYVCDDKFGMRDADVLCRELGFPLGANEVQGNSYYPPSADMLNEQNQVSFVMDEVDCSGNETSLKDCEFKGWGVHDCSSDEIVGVECKIPLMKCQSDDYWLCTTSKQCIPHSFVCDNIPDCSDQSDESSAVCNSTILYRLVNGGSPDEGRVEVKYHGVWGTICDDDFTENEAKVVCQSLGFSGPSKIVKNAFGPGTGPIWLDQVSCSGNETSIDKCVHWTWGEHNCNHSEDVSLKCSSGNSPIGNSRTGNSPKSPKSPKLIKEDEIDLNLDDLERSSKITDQKCGHININVVDEFEHPEERVVEGSSAKRGHHPWQAAIRTKGHNGNSNHWCGAVIISKRHLLTAAHCLVGFPKASYLIRMGDHYSNIAETSEIDAFIENWYIHEQFRNGTRMNNDLALILIKSPIRFNDYIQPVCLPAKDSKYTAGKVCQISGWGSSGVSRTSNKLLSAEVPIISDDVCKQPHIYGAGFTKNMFCAGFLDEGVDACKGDSGGPFVCSDNDAETLYGIISWGERCGISNKPGVYVKINQYIDWIQENIRKSLESKN